MSSDVLMALVAKHIESLADKKKIDLESEDVSSEIARAQGFIRGAADCLSLIKERYGAFPLEDDHFSDIDGLDVKYLEEVCSAISVLKASDNYTAYCAEKDNLIDEKKNWLFTESQKGRDLFYVKGWYKAVCEEAVLFNSLESELKFKKQRSIEELDFEGEDDGK